MNAHVKLRLVVPAQADHSFAKRETAERLPAIISAATPEALWDEMLDYCTGLGCWGMAFYDLTERPSPAVLLRSSYPVDVAVDVERLRQDLAGSKDIMVQLDALTLAIPAYGPRGLEAALVLRLGSPKNGLPGCSQTLCAAVQLGYSRYRQMRPIAREEEVPLSDREREIMQWVVRGKSNTVIGTILGISASTVDTYMRRIFRKLDVGDRTSAAMRAVAVGAVA